MTGASNHASGRVRRRAFHAATMPRVRAAPARRGRDGTARGTRRTSRGGSRRTLGSVSPWCCGGRPSRTTTRRTPRWSPRGAAPGGGRAAPPANTARSGSGLRRCRHPSASTSAATATRPSAAPCFISTPQAAPTGQHQQPPVPTDRPPRPECHRAGRSGHAHQFPVGREALEVRCRREHREQRRQHRGPPPRQRRAARWRPSRWTPPASPAPAPWAPSPRRPRADRRRAAPVAVRPRRSRRRAARHVTTAGRPARTSSVMSGTVRKRRRRTRPRRTARPMPTSVACRLRVWRSPAAVGPSSGPSPPAAAPSDGTVPPGPAGAGGTSWATRPPYREGSVGPGCTASSSWASTRRVGAEARHAATTVSGTVTESGASVLRRAKIREPSKRRPRRRTAAESAPVTTPPPWRSWVVSAVNVSGSYSAGPTSSNHPSVVPRMPRPRSSARTSGSTVPRSSPMTKAPWRLASTVTMSSSSGGEPHVGTTLGTGARRQPELAEEAHHVVDAQTTRVDEHGSDRIPERLEAGRPQLPGHVGGQPQSCPSGPSSSGGAPIRHVSASRSWSYQASKPPASKPTARSWSTATGPSDGAQLLVHEPLAPGMEAQPVGAEGQRLLSDRGARRVLEARPAMSTTGRGSRRGRSTGPSAGSAGP